MQSIINLQFIPKQNKITFLFAFFVKSDFLFSLNDDPGPLFVSTHGIAVLVGSSLSARKNIAQSKGGTMYRFFCYNQENLLFLCVHDHAVLAVLLVCLFDAITNVHIRVVDLMIIDVSV